MGVLKIIECKGFTKDEAFAKIVDNYIRKQNGLLAWFLRKFYLLYKYCK